MRSRMRGSAKAPDLDPTHATAKKYRRRRHRPFPRRTSRLLEPQPPSGAGRVEPEQPLVDALAPAELDLRAVGAGKRRSVADLVVAGFPTAAAVVEPVSPQPNVELSLAEDAVLLAFATVLDLIALATASSGLDGHRHTLACLRIARNVPSVTVSRGPMSRHESRVLQKQWIIDGTAGGGSASFSLPLAVACGSGWCLCWALASADWSPSYRSTRWSRLASAMEFGIPATWDCLLYRSLGSSAWVLAFRSWIGALPTALMIPPLVARIQSEERRLRQHFGSEYDAYWSRTS